MIACYIATVAATKDPLVYSLLERMRCICDARVLFAFVRCCRQAVLENKCNFHFECGQYRFDRWLRRAFALVQKSKLENSDFKMIIKYT